MEELNQEIIKAEEELKLLNERRKELIEKILWLKKQKDFVSKPLIVADDQKISVRKWRTCLDIHRKFAIIDQRIIWYGSINVLSFGNEDENIMRFESNNVANELMRGLEI